MDGQEDHSQNGLSVRRTLKTRHRAKRTRMIQIRKTRTERARSKGTRT